MDANGMDSNGVRAHGGDTRKYSMTITYDMDSQQMALTGDQIPDRVTQLGMLDMARHLLTSSWKQKPVDRSSGLLVPRGGLGRIGG